MHEATESLTFSPDGKLFAATVKSQTRSIGHSFAVPFATMAIWRTKTGRLIAQPSDLGAGNGLAGFDAVAFSRDGKLLAATLLAGGVRIFDPATGRVLRQLTAPGDQSVSVAFAPNRMLAAGTLGGTVETWNAANGHRLAAPLLAASAPISAVAFDSSGRRLATAGYRTEPEAVVHHHAPTRRSRTRSRSRRHLHGGVRTCLGETARSRQRRQGLRVAGVADRVGAAGVLAGRRNLTRAEWRQYVARPGHPTVCRRTVSPRH